MQKHLVVLSGAGISQQSGIQTFRDADGLWQGYDIMEVASIEGWNKNPDLVLDFYNKRRKQLLSCNPNAAHLALKELEAYFKISIITQNVDDLHERANSSDITHLHGELLKVRSLEDESLVYPWHKDLLKHHENEQGHRLRPHIVWFGEMVPMMDKAIEKVEKADIILIIGTSLQVYPAAGLLQYAKPDVPVYYIDPNPGSTQGFSQDITLVKQTATKGMSELLPELIQWSKK